MSLNETIMNNLSHWNYRILAFKENTEIVFQICEVYYENNIPIRYGEKTIPSTTQGIKALRWIIDQYEEAFNKPILWGGENFPKKYEE